MLYIFYVKRSGIMGKAIPTVEGWHSQHMVFSMDFSAWNCFDAEEKARLAVS